MNNEEWFKKRKREKQFKIAFSLLLFYMLYAVFFNFIIIIYFFATSLGIAVVVMITEIIEIIKEGKDQLP